MVHPRLENEPDRTRRGRQIASDISPADRRVLEGGNRNDKTASQRSNIFDCDRSGYRLPERGTLGRMGAAQSFAARRIGAVKQRCAESALSVAANELFDAAVRFVVCHLHGRMLGKIGGGGMQYTADAAIESKLA